MVQSTSHSPCGVVVLAAGLGKRMRSALPKVLHPIAGRPLLFHVLNAVKKALPGSPVAVVVGHGREEVEAYLQQEVAFQGMSIEFIVQSQPRGTGDALRFVMESDWGRARVEASSPLLVFPGDVPLVSSDLVQKMALPLVGENQKMRLLTCRLEQPAGYGRVVRHSQTGTALRIVEEKDASCEERKIQEVAVSIYLFDSHFLSTGLKRLSNQNAQGEYYLTDIVSQVSKAKKEAEILVWESSEDLRGINDPWELAQVSQFMNQKLLKAWAQKGVTFKDITNTWLDVTVELNEGVVVYPGVILEGETKIGRDVLLGPQVYLKDVQVEEGATLKMGTVGERSLVKAGAQMGPYAHLRPQSVVGCRAKIGNFVELKKTQVGDDTQIAHLSYLGDAQVGKNVNIGCGFITCNFDGRVIEGQRKHPTVIEDDVFMGSDCQAVAPIRIGKGAFVASGSTLTEDVPKGSLAIARSRQVNKLGYAQKLKTSREE